jgi:ditrans,polycis-polyprenyl diphosphate synthase
MQSLNLPIPIYNNNLAPRKADKHSLFRNTRDQTHRFPTLLLAAKHDLDLKEEEDKGVAAVPLPEGLLREAMPRHVAVIMDGNARWARQRGFIALSAGHEAGARSLRELVELCCDWGVRVLTVFAFSYDNWIRPKVSSLPSLFLSFGKYFSSDGVHNFLK